jgi:hypothetical protein
MARLPEIGFADENEWAVILLDWLRVHGNEDGTLKADAVLAAIGSSAAGGGGAQATYIIEKTTVGGFPSYTAKNSHGALVRQYTDTLSSSGLKQLLEELAVDYTTFAFLGTPRTDPAVPEVTRFHFIDAPLGTETWAGDQDHAAYVRARGLRFIGEGIDRVVISNRSNQIDRTAVALTDLTESGFTVTATSTAAHDLRVGTVITLRSASSAGYNGTWTVTAVPTATTFQFTALTSGLAHLVGGNAGVFDEGLVDTEPFSFTNCPGLEITGMTIESNGRPKSTTDCIDLDDGANGLIHQVKIRASRARGVTIDGGYNGQWAGKTTFRDNIIQGRPAPPQMIALTGGSLVATQLHQYVVSWVLNDLAKLIPTAASFSAGTYQFTFASVPASVAVGMQINVRGMFPDTYNGSFRVSAVSGTTITVDQHWDGSSLADPGGAAGTMGTVIAPDETKPSDPTPIYTDATFRSARIYLSRGPYNCVAQRIYRYDSTTGSWKFVTQTANNALGDAPPITQYNDSADPTTLSAAAFKTKSSIADGGIEVMAGLDCKVLDNYIDGVGNSVDGTNGYGINVVRKQYGPPSNQTGFNYESMRTLIRGNTVRHSARDGVKVFGGDDTSILGNSISNCGTPASTIYSGIKIDSGAPAPNSTSDRCLIAHNTIWDDQTAASWSGGASTQYAVSVAAGCNDTQIKDNNLGRGGFVTNYILDNGTGTVTRGNKGYVTMNKGTATLLAANGSVTVSHGLSKTPALSDIRVTPTSSWFNTTKWWISSVGASNFVISVDVVPGTNMTFSWLVDTAASPG